MPDETQEELALSSPPLRENVDPNFALDEGEKAPPEEDKVDDSGEEKTEEEQPSKISFEIDPEDIHGSLDKLFQEQPKVHNYFNTRVGQKAAAQHAPRIAELETELQRLNYQVVQTEVGTMSDEDVKEKLGTDPAFRQRHDSLEGAPADIQAREAQQRVKTTIADTLDHAVEQGLPMHIGEEILAEVGKGSFDKNTDGTARSTADALSAFTANVMSAVREHAAPVKIPADEDTTKSTSKIKDSSSPDMKPGDRVTTNNLGKFTAEQVTAMTPLEKIEHWPNDGDWERAIRNGDITGIDSNTFSEVGTV